MDRRVHRTRTALYDALVALIRERGVEAVTVEDIIRRADVSRSTFYAHFTGKHDLLAKSLDRLKAMLEAVAAAEAVDGTAWSLALFRHIEAYSDVYHALAGAAEGQVLRQAIRGVLVGFVRDRVATPPGLPATLAAAYAADCLMTTITWWLERQPGLPPEAVDHLFRRLLAGEVGLS